MHAAAWKATRDNKAENIEHPETASGIGMIKKFDQCAECIDDTLWPV